MTLNEDETRELVLQLEIAEAEDRKEKVQGKARQGSALTDEQLALELHLEELERSRQILGDDHLAHSIAHALGTDADIIALYQEMHRMETADRALAMRLSGSTVTSVPVNVAMRRPAEQPRTLSKVLMEARAGMPGASGSNQSGLVKESCTICMDPIGRKTYLKVPCGHFYDEKCLVTLIQSASKDESMFPPRCCKKSIPQESFLPFLSRDIRALFTKSSAEFSTRPRDRVYCSNPACSAFLNAEIQSPASRSIRCPECARYTCPACRETAHPDTLICKQPDAGSGIQALVEEKKWQRCPECQSIIELAQGCFHLTCRCAAQFCYLCAAPWRTCTCPQWEERLLIAEAERRVDAELELEEVEVVGHTAAVAAVAPAVERQNRIDRMTTRLRENHACDHSWHLAHGAGDCSNCSKYYNRYLLRCRNCYIDVCVPCTRNRM